MSAALETECLVVGGGMAGLSATARLAAAGKSAICIEAGPRPSSETVERDRRTTAILNPGIETLRKAGVWEAMAADSQPMHGLRILDCGGKVPEPREDVLFEASELGDGPFGWNVENGRARLKLADRIDTLASASLVTGVRLAHSLARRDGIIARLDDGRRIKAQLLIGADGRGSGVRAAAEIGIREVHYRQRALACRITHGESHHAISTEMHHVGGPLTFAPLPGNASGVVWMNPNSEAERLEALSDSDFLAELNANSSGILGVIDSVAERVSFPTSSVVARALRARRTVLIAEAAHALPPIGAQGFNMSLRDIETLATLLEDESDAGEDQALRAYARRRLPDILARCSGVDLLNRSVLSDLRAVRDMRRAGLGILGRAPHLKRFAMRVGMGG